MLDIIIYDRASAPPALLARCLRPYIAVVGPDVSLEQRAWLRERGCAVFDKPAVCPAPLVLMRPAEA